MYRHLIELDIKLRVKRLLFLLLLFYLFILTKKRLKVETFACIVSSGFCVAVSYMAERVMLLC